MTYPGKEREWYKVLFRSVSNPSRWRKGMFYWNGAKPTFASYGIEITGVIEWKYAD